MDPPGMSDHRFLVIRACEECPHLRREEVIGLTHREPLHLLRCGLGGFWIRPNDLPLHDDCPLPPAYLEPSGEIR